MPYCDISDRAQMSKTIIAVKHFALGGRESLETAVKDYVKVKRLCKSGQNMFLILDCFMNYY